MMRTAEAVEMAKMDFPRMYQVPRKRTFLERVFRRPGPKPKMSEITYRGRRTSIRGALNRIGEFREDPTDWHTLNLMRKYPMIKLALIVRLSPIITALREVRIECEDPAIKAFIKEVFVKRMIVDLAQSAIKPSWEFGTAPHEKVWETVLVRATYKDEDTQQEVVAWDGPATIYKKIRFVHPETLKNWLLDGETQDFAGFVQKKRIGEDKDRTVEDWKAFVYVNRFLYGGLWGETEMTDIYPYWYYAEFFRALMADFLRFKAVPPIVGWAPTGVREDEDGNEVDNIVYAADLLEKAYDNLVIVLPAEFDETTRQMMWGYKQLEMGDRGGDIYAKGVEELDVMILRGLIVPERTVTQNMAAVGSYNQAEVHQERMIDASKLETDEFLKACNKWAIPQLIEDNFGAGAPPARLFSHGLSEDLKLKLHAIVIALLQNDKAGIHRAQVAFQDLLDLLNIPAQAGPTGFPEPQEEE